ncbi:unnamed protein product [Adineta steineri]|uniref:Uncharacterized protein n=1 Tax=Adineta steineri TaxID=433720 RepID=A0A816AYJ3_9BILA|nr:unnamed protein product [Adineta steineri]CAF1600863.1 unnamed protein product [Adineta steineri]
MDVLRERNVYRKYFGVVLLLLEMNFLGGTIFGFPSMFKILSKMNIYQNLCQPSNTTQCAQQTKHYQNAMTLGIAFFDLPALFIGILIDKFGCRFVKLISILFHIVGWLSLALLKPGRDYLIYIHCIFSSLSGIVIVLTSYTSSNYFSKSRAFVSSLLAGAGISATMWFAIFQVLVDGDYVGLNTLSYIWLSFGFLMFLTSFLFLDWNYSYWNLPYKFNIELESNNQNELNENNLWKNLLNPLYLLVVLFLSILLIPSVLLSVIWEPLITFITNHDDTLADKYTFAYNISTISAIIICPINGYLLSYKSDKNKKQKLLNIFLVETISWLLNIILCIICIFASSKFLILILILNCLSRSTIVAACQSVISTFFPSKYIGRLTGIMWSFVGAFTFIQFALLKLTDDINKAWRAWVVVLSMVLIMVSHLIQILIKYLKEKKNQNTDFNLNNSRF